MHWMAVMELTPHSLSVQIKMRDAQWSEVRIRVLPDLDPLPSLVPC